MAHADTGDALVGLTVGLRGSPASKLLSWLPTADVFDVALNKNARRVA